MSKADDRGEIERVILGGWILEQQREGKIEIELQRVEDVRAGIKAALDYCLPFTAPARDASTPSAR
jgi:hypothetical protein